MGVQEIPSPPNGIDWSGKTYQTNMPSGTAQSNTWADITGSGYVISAGHFGDSNPVTISIQIDGGTILTFVGIRGFLPLFPIRFNTSLQIKSSGVASTQQFALVVLD